MGIDCKKVGCQTKRSLLVFSKACCGSVREHPFLSGILVFIVLLYAVFPAAFFFLLSSSPVIICTAILLGTLLSFGNPHIPEICEEKEEKTREISSLKADGGVDLVVTKKDGNSEMEVPLLEKERNTMETIEEEAIKNRNFGDEGGEIKGGDSLRLEIQKKDERVVSGVATDEEDLVFTPTQGRPREGLGLGAGRLEKAIHESRLAGNLKAGESQDDSSRGKFYCRSNSRRTVRFVMNDIGKDKEENKVEEDHVEETKHKADDFEVRDNVSEAYVEDSFASSLGSSPWMRIDRHDQSSSGLDHDDQLSHSSSEHAESSSPDASMADILPMLDELHPLLDSETPQPASLEVSEGNSEQSSENHDSDDEDDNDEEDDDEDDDDVSTELEKEGGESREGENKGHEVMSGVKWTDDDTKNVMDLGSSELERNRRLENLMAKRRARRNQKIELEKDLIDLQSDEKISLLDMDDSSFNILDSVSLQASPFLIRSATLPSIRRNPFDLPCDGEEELAEVSVPASARAPSTFSAKRNPFDLPYDHAGVDGMLTGETSSHGDFMAVQQKGLYTNEAHLLGGPQFGGFQCFPPVNPPVNTSLAEPHKQHSESSFHGHHAADAVGKDIPQVSTSNGDPLGEGIFPSIQKGSTDSSMSFFFQTPKDHELHGEAHGAQIVDAATYASIEPGESDSSSPERESDSEEEEKHMEIQEGQSNPEEDLVHDVESVASDITEEHIQEPESFDHHVGSTSPFPGLEEESEMPSEEMQMKSRKVHMEVARLGSPEHVILPLDESPSKQYAASDVVEEDFDDSNSSTSSDEDELQFGGNVHEESDKSFWTGASTSTTEIAQPCSRDPHILIKEADDSRVGEPVFDSSPSAQEKIHSGLASLVEGDPFTEKGIFPCSSGASDAPVESSEQVSHDIEVEKNIVHEFKEETADGESKSVIQPSMAFSDSDDLLADVSVPVGDDQSHTNLSNQSHLPEVKEAVIETIQPSNNQEKAEDIHVAELSPRALSKDGEAFADVHAHPSNAEEVAATAAVSVVDLPVTISERMPPKEAVSAVDLSAVDDYHVSEMKDSSENAHEGCLQSANALPVDHPPAELTLLTGSQILETKELHESLGLSDMEHGTSEMIQGGSHNESPKNIHVSLSEGARQDIADENYVATSRVLDPVLPVSESSAMDDDTNRPNTVQISKDHPGADHDVWVMGEEEVACIKDLDEDLLTELDRIGDFRVAEESASMNRPQKQLEIHSDGESKEEVATGDLIQMPVLEPKLVEDIGLALKQFSEGESSKPNEDKSEPSYGQSELEFIEARALDDMEELMMQLSKEFSEKHGDGSKVMQLQDISDEHAEPEVPEARPREDIELVSKQINKDDAGEATDTTFTEEQEKQVETDADKSEPKSAESVPSSVVHEVHSFDEREFDGDEKEDIHRSLDHHGDRKEEVDHRLDASTEHVETKESKD
ncbi:hypothetical protein EJ110_NYTH43467 [Nymphaea thermarum]|nr:hypothetical protein EJ110_NYTH43467 [Nymphaea thermarum]